MNNLKYYRKLNNYKQKDIAKYLKITQPNYSNIENNKVKLNFEYAEMLSRLYKVNISNLINSDENTINITKKDFKTIIQIKEIIINLERKYLK